MSFRTPSYRLHKPTNQAVVTIGGRDSYLGAYNSAKSRAEYDRLIAEWLVNGRQVAAIHSATVNELMVGYIRNVDLYYVKDGSPTSEAGLIRLSLRVLKALYGHTPARDFGPLALKSLRQTYIDSGLCRSEVNRRTRHVIRFFKWAVENEFVPASVHHGLRAVSGLRKGRTEARETEPVKPVPNAHVDAILPHVARQVSAMIDWRQLEFPGDDN